MLRRPPTRRVALGVALLVAACAPPPAAPPPLPPVPVDSARAARADSIRADSVRAAQRDSALAAARRDSVVRDSVARAEAEERARRAEREAPPVRPDRTMVRMARREGVVRLCAGGDVTLGTNLDTTWARRAGRPAFPDPHELLAPLRPLLGDADVVLLNVEGAIGEGEAPSKCRPGSTACYAFRQPVPTAAALRAVAPEARVVGNLANNHARDAGTAGFHQTRRHLERADVHVTGADTLPTIVVSPLGDTIAVLGFATSPGGPDVRDLAAVRRHVRRAAARHRRVVVTMHMGAEGRGAQRTRRETEMFYGASRGNPVAFAEAAVEAGADLVVGHGPHVLRAAEWRDQALVVYSLGNLVTYGPFNNDEPLNRGALACAALGPDGEVLQALLRPTVQRRPGIVAADPERRALVLVDSLSRLDFPRTGVRVRPDGLLTRRGVTPATSEDGEPSASRP